MSHRLALALAVALVASPAAATESLDWLGARLPNGPGQPWGYAVDGRKPNPGGLPLADVEQAFRSAFDAWQDVSCSYIAFAYRGLDRVRGPAQPDGANVMGTFIESKLEDEEFYDLALGGGAAVAAAVTLFYGGTIYECDVGFNAVDYGFATDGRDTAFDVMTLALHETGHCLGLDHGGDGAMYGWVGLGEVRRILQPHDVDNICQLYPQVGEVGSPCGAGCGSLTCVGSGATAYCTKGCNPAAVGECPVGFSCRSSSAVPGSPGACGFGGEGSTLVGAPCARQQDCGTALDAVCFLHDPILDSWRDGYCTANCDGVPCPANSSCYADFTDGHRWCLKDCRPGESDCRPGYACQPQGKGGGRCRPACHSDGECPGGICNHCDGLCTHSSGGRQVGESCTDDLQCPAGAVCRTDLAGGTCALPCGGRCTSCPSGTTCGYVGSTGERLCVRGCKGSTDCPPGMGCWEETSGSSCKPACGRDEDCPVGLRCSAGSCLRGEGRDAGCALCNHRDASSDWDWDGEPDASEDSGAPPGGCGCAAPGGPEVWAAGLVWAAWMLAGSRARRRGRSGRAGGRERREES